MMTPQTPIDREARLISGFHEIAAGYDVVLSDVWGVIHDGLTAFPAACDALQRFRAKGGAVILVSNAPRPGEIVATQLDRLGVSRSAYDGIVTSGDLSRGAVAERADQVVYHLGPERDHSIYDGLPARLGTLEEADYVVCTGFFDDDTETPEDYRDELARMHERKLWMVCANPDIVVERGDRLIPCAGAMALAYEKIGGEVYYAGKPHRPVYEEALARAVRATGGPMPAKERVMAIGDSIRTDIAGGSGFGIDTLLIARGIHAAELGLSEGRRLDPEITKGWVGAQAARPTYIQQELVWA